jgi:hypothetical protein
MSASRWSLPAHVHDWPADPRWENLEECHTCGIRMLDVFVNSPDWVVRRVEHITFRDDRTAQRRVTVDYDTPRHTVTLRRRGVDDRRDRQNDLVRIVPLTMMRRKTLVNFNLRDADGTPMPLLGLRESQALTSAVLCAWARESLREAPGPDTVKLLKRIARGSQAELDEARIDYRGAPASSQLGRLRNDKWYNAFLARFGDKFLLYGVDAHPPGERHVVKFGYDEPLVVRFSKAGFDSAHPDRYSPGDPLRRPSWAGIRSSLGASLRAGRTRTRRDLCPQSLMGPTPGS